ncbi:MAG: hypothetical protein QGH38_03610 [Candidatus Thalassarchaeaceae archaeon]|nr:hypothetical protein [Candidatus Thalassarchaeaceae archaeon]
MDSWTRPTVRMYATQNKRYEIQPILESRSTWSGKSAEASERDIQSTGSENIDPSDMGWEFLEKIRGRKIKPHAKENEDNANAWSLGVLPGKASGNAVNNRKNGAQARGLSRDHARGRIR